MSDLPPSEHKWHADRPGLRPEDDKLGRTAFAELVAKELRGWHHNDSLVLSLNGDWGSGKTMLINLVVHCIREQSKAANEKAPTIVRFNPWQWSGQEKLLVAFFDEIGAVFHGNQLGDKFLEERLASFWEGLKVVTVAGQEIADRLQQSLSTLAAALAGGSGVVAGLSGNHEVRLIMGISAAALLGFSAVCGIYAPVAEKIAAVLGFMTKKRPESVEGLRLDLRKELEKLKVPLIVVIDDIDRLTRRQVRMLVQLVKANADFPNIIYILLYQKDIVAHALQEVAGQDGHDFLKKIVQVELEVPAAPEHLLRKFFDGQISPIIFGKTKSRWSQERWGQLFEEVVWPWFRTPRDIKRFKSTLEFYYEAHTDNGRLDVNPIDLILLEILRVFDSTAYEVVGRGFQNQRNLFIEFLFADEEAKKRILAGVDELAGRKELDENSRNRLSALLIALFPQALANAKYSPEEKLEWLHDLRICHAKMFQRYFQLGGNPGDATDSYLDRLFALGGDQPKLRELLKSAFDSGMFSSLMERIRAARKDVPPSSVESFLTAFFDLSDKLPAPTSINLFESMPERELAGIAVLLLKRIEDRAERFAVLRRAVTASSGITGPVMTTAFLEPEKDNPKPDSELPLDRAVLTTLHSELLPRLWEAVRTGILWDLRSAGYLLYRLRNWAGVEAVRAWLASAVAEPKTANGFLHAMASGSRVTAGARVYIQYVLPAVGIEEFISLEELASHVTKDGSDRLHQATIEALRKAIELKKDGRVYSEVYILSKYPDGEYFVETNPIL